MTAKYGVFCVIIRRLVAYRGIVFVPNEALFFKFGTKGIDQGQTIPFVVMFRSGRKGLHERQYFVRL
jgi:hypothetical protein